MVLFEIDTQRPPVLPLESNAPRAVDMDRISPWAGAAQPMEIEAGLVERFQATGPVDRIQTHYDAAVQIGPHTTALASLEQFPQAAMPKAFDHPIGS